MRTSRRSVLVAAAAAAAAVTIAAALMLASPAFGQAPSTTDPAARCAQVKPTVVIVGRADRLFDSTITFTVLSVRSGEGGAGTSVEIRYPTKYNAGKLELGLSYLVAAVQEGDHLNSVVPTADLKGCGQYTRNADGTPIETSALAGVEKQGPRLAKLVIAGVVITLIVLVLLGRFLDRKSRYAQRTISSPRTRKVRRKDDAAQ